MTIPKLNIVIIILLILIITTIIISQNMNINTDTEFSGDEAFIHVKQQLSFGARTIGSVAHAKTQSYIHDQLDQNGWEVVNQPVQVNDSLVIRNITAKLGNESPWLLIGAHYDSRFFADQDSNPEKRMEPVPGANDGASGVGILLELARTIPKKINKQIWLVFFDAEDNGNIDGYDWIMGSQLYAENLTSYPDAVVIVDMVGDQDLDLFVEKNSDPNLANELWMIAQELGYSEFHLTQKHRMLDDHIPFTSKGIPAVDIIDFDYPYWHTTADTLDKVSPQSLAIVGNTLLSWIKR